MQQALNTALEKAWSWQTCWPPMRAQWSAANPAHGQCLVTSLIVQKYAGGDLIMSNVKIPGQTEPVLHFFNRLADGDIDLTRRQFPEGSILTERPLTIPANRTVYDECLNDPDTHNRFRILLARIKL